jgi:hypothetical protein
MPRKYRKYTRELLEAAVQKCVSVSGVLRFLGVPLAGGTLSNVSRRIKQFGIDTSHFLGQGANCGPNHRGPRKLLSNEILVLRTEGRRQKAYILRRALLESGRKYRCEIKSCPIRQNWLGKPLTLHVDHQNGNWLDDRVDNLRFVCPNCHSQTENYCRGPGRAIAAEPRHWLRGRRKQP